MKMEDQTNHYHHQHSGGIPPSITLEMASKQVQTNKQQQQQQQQNKQQQQQKQQQQNKQQQNKQQQQQEKPKYGYTIVEIPFDDDKPPSKEDEIKTTLRKLIQSNDELMKSVNRHLTEQSKLLQMLIKSI
jgi:transcription initiation factor TFIID subunit TAF12